MSGAKKKQQREKKRKEARKKAKAQLRSQPRIFRLHPGLKESLKHDLPLRACLINADWEEKRRAVISLVREAPAGLVVASYQVDLAERGFINAWGNYGLSPEQVEQMRQDYEQNKGPLKDCELLLARQIIFGGLDWAKDWGYKYPKEAELWLKLLEPITEEHEMDFSLFG